MGRMEGAATNRMRRGDKHGVSSYVGRSECLCESKSQGVKPLLACCTWKKNNLFTCRHYECVTSKQENLISYRRHSENARLKRRRGSPMMGVVDFELFPGVCVLSHISVCFVLDVCQGDSHAGSLIENPFPRYSVVNKGIDRSK